MHWCRLTNSTRGNDALRQGEIENPCTVFPRCIDFDVPRLASNLLRDMRAGATLDDRKESKGKDDNENRRMGKISALMSKEKLATIHSSVAVLGHFLGPRVFADLYSTPSIVSST